MSEKVVSGFGCPRRNGVPCLVNRANIEICIRTGQLSFWSDGSLMISSDAERHGIRAIGIKVHAQLQKDLAVKVSEGGSLGCIFAAASESGFGANLKRSGWRNQARREGYFNDGISRGGTNSSFVRWRLAFKPRLP